MNPWQMAQQLKQELTTVAWPGGSADAVFGARGVVVFAGTPTEEQIPAGFPWCLVGIGAGVPDPSHPELIEQTFSLITGAEVAGDPQGEFAIIGGSVADLGKSVGRGITEVTERVRAAVQKLTGADGAKMIVSATAIDTPSALGGGRHLVVDEHTVSAWCTSQLHYAAPQVLAESADVWTWEGAHCSDRFDFLQYRLGRKAGSTPPATPADADAIVYTGTPSTTTHTAVAGQSYAVFADYNARGGSTVDGSSSGSEKGASILT